MRWNNPVAGAILLGGIDRDMCKFSSAIRLGGSSVVSTFGCAAFMWILFGALPVEAQLDTGTILGTVRNRTGGVVPGAKVTLTNEGTSVSAATRSAGDGSYIFTPVRIGNYTVSAEFQGFQTARRTHVKVDIQQQVVVDFSLQPGQITQTLEVTAQRTVLQTQSGSLGQVVNSQQVNDLPLNRPQLHLSRPTGAGSDASAQYDTRADWEPAETSPRTGCARPRTTICSTASKTIICNRISAPGQPTPYCLRSTRFRNSKSRRALSSAPNSAGQAAA